MSDVKKQPVYVTCPKCGNSNTDKMVVKDPVVAYRPLRFDPDEGTIYIGCEQDSEPIGVLSILCEMQDCETVWAIPKNAQIDWE